MKLKNNREQKEELQNPIKSVFFGLKSKSFGKKIWLNKIKCFSLHVKCQLATNKKTM